MPEEEAVHARKAASSWKGLRLESWASYRRQELLTMLDQLDASLREMDHAVAEQAQQNAAAVL